ncbi:MAG: HIT family hydrolase [Solibacterales bacterium]|nr:HIT family hydrolase [Bryobacterales bacterium]
MDYLWTPWRYKYITEKVSEEGCVFCQIAESNDDEANLVVHRGKDNFVVLNRYPYNSGHAMVLPFRHVATLGTLGEDVAAEMMRLTQQLETTVRKLYRSEGVNVGMNIGKAAGAGVAGHIHMHVLPRWIGDSNFETVVAETRVLPEELPETWRRLRDEFRRVAP